MFVEQLLKRVRFRAIRLYGRVRSTEFIGVRDNGRCHYVAI